MKQTLNRLKISTEQVHLFHEDPTAIINRLNVLESQADKEPLNIVVFGKYNHGKSSFLNAWLKQDLFKTEDVRCTVKTQSHEDTQQGIIWTDTPGLDADENDDAIAEAAIKNADLVLLTHDVISGELDKKELDFIRHYAQGVGKGKIRLLLTKIDQAESEVKKISELIQQQLHAIAQIPCHEISSTRYQKYIKTGSTAFLTKSGFDVIAPMIAQAMQDKVKNRYNEVSTLYSVLLKDLKKANIKQTKQAAKSAAALQQQQLHFEQAKNNLLNHLY